MRPLVISLILVLSCTFAQARDISMHDFSVGFELETKGDSGLYSLVIPREVYETVTRKDLSDIGIFNNSGETVPHVLRMNDGPEKHQSEPVNIPFFPLLSSGGDKQQHELKMLVDQKESGTSVEITSTPGNQGQSNKAEAYLFDLSSIAKEISELEFSWDRVDETTLLHITIEQSSDLVTWYPLVSGAALADLNYLGSLVSQKKIVLPKIRGKYLKMSWQKKTFDLRLTKVLGFIQATSPAAPYYWIEPESHNEGLEQNLPYVEYRLDKNIKPTAFQLEFPANNAIASLRLLSRAEKGESWKKRCDLLFYSLKVDGADLKSTPCFFRHSDDSLWRLQKGEGSSGFQENLGKFRLKLGWQPHELIFIGQGEPPYTLAYGSGKLARVEVNMESKAILQALQKHEIANSINPAILGKKIELGGEKALRVAMVAQSWKQILLWAVLILGVAILAYMARTLLKENKRQK